MRLITILILGSLLISSCKSNKNAVRAKLFTPIVVDTMPKGSVFFYTDSMKASQMGVDVITITKFDTTNLLLSYNILRKYVNPFGRRSTEKDSGNIEILINTNQELSIDTFIERQRLYDDEDIDDMFARLEKEKTKNKLIRAFPVFILNKDSFPINIGYQDGMIPMIQEAKDKSGEWMPIEFWLYSWCGNSYGSYDIPSNYCAITKIPIYSGEYKTELRVKVKINSTIYYSKPFKGSVNLSQFVKTFGEWENGSFLE